MPILVIESEWREMPMLCPDCGGIMYSDGNSLPVCGDDYCLYPATLHDVLEWLITEHPMNSRINEKRDDFGPQGEL